MMDLSRTTCTQSHDGHRPRETRKLDTRTLTLSNHIHLEDGIPTLYIRTGSFLSWRNLALRPSGRNQPIRNCNGRRAIADLCASDENLKTRPDMGNARPLPPQERPWSMPAAPGCRNHMAMGVKDHDDRVCTLHVQCVWLSLAIITKL